MLVVPVAVSRCIRARDGRRDGVIERRCKCYAPCQSHLGPGFGSGQTRSLDGRGFSERVAVLTRLSHPGFQSRAEGSLRGVTARRAER